MVNQPRVIPGHYTPWFVRGFGKYVRWLLARKFQAVRLDRSGFAGDGDGPRAPFAPLDQEPRPLIVLLSHSSWWDPLVGVLIGTMFLPSRSGCIPMDRAMLAKLGFFRRIGMFGIDPDDPASLPAMARYVGERFAQDARPTLWITPQGEFADPRAPIALRPGAALIAARTPGAIVLTLCIEYAFWLSSKPEVFVRLSRVPDTHIAGANEPLGARAWQERLTLAMRDNAHALASGVTSRDPSRFRVILGRSDAGAIDTTHRRAHADRPRTGGGASAARLAIPREAPR